MKDDRIAELDREELPVEEFMRRCTQPLSEESIQGTRELSEWFLRRYPTAQERFAYIRRACARVLGGGHRSPPRESPPR
jgi:hypothetical protein